MKKRVISEKLMTKKLEKKNNIIEAAYNLFIEKGIGNTAIDEIVKRAGVAKGTFYLYFKNKNDIVEKLIIKKCAEITRIALEKAKQKEYSNFIDAVIEFIDHLIEYLKQNKPLFKIINKNLSWGFFRKVIEVSDEYQSIKESKEIFMEHFKSTRYSKEEIELVVFMIVDLIGSIAYSSIVRGEPTNIDELKPTLYKTIRKILE